MFKTGIVLYYVSEYSNLETLSIKGVLDEARENKTLSPNIEEETSYVNLIKNLPIGTIICKVLKQKIGLVGNEEVVICLPMFSSHFSMPVKVNELIWFIEDTYSYDKFDKGVHESLPLLNSVKNYWLSRKIGFKITEDLNYSYYQRDSLITEEEISDLDFSDTLVTQSTNSNDKKISKIYKESIKDNIKIPNFENEEFYKDVYGKIISDGSSIFNEEKNFSFYPDAVPRWFSKPYELTLQGSNNSLINLTNTNASDTQNIRKGAIDIVAGRHAVLEYVDKVTLDLENKNIVNISEENLKKINKIDLNIQTNNFPKIKNSSNEFETLKSEEYYLGTEDILDDQKVEGFSNFEYDASRIYVTEVDNLDSMIYYDLDYISYQTVLIFDKENMAFESFGNEPETKGYLQDEESVKRDNLSSEIIDFEDNDLILPSVLIKSNDLRFVARKEYKSEKTLEEGSIRLIKESNDFLTYSHICMENDGQIAIDGNSILLGNFNKELARNNLFDEEGNVDEESLATLHGKGNGVLIGYDEELSEPLVLGNTLESMIKELLNINIFLVEELEKVSNNLVNHTHCGVFPGNGITQNPNNILTKALVRDTNTFIDSSSGDIEIRYKNLKGNLNQMLSRFAKTT